MARCDRTPPNHCGVMGFRQWRLRSLTTISARGTAHYAGKDAVKLRVASKAGLKSSIEHSSAAACSIKLKKSLEPLAIAEVDEGKAGRLMKEAAQARRTQACLAGNSRQIVGVRTVANQARCPLYSRMNVMDWYICSLDRK